MFQGGVRWESNSKARKGMKEVVKSSIHKHSLWQKMIKIAQLIGALPGRTKYSFIH